MEKDDELKGGGNSYDFGARIYDARVGRFLSLDPMQEKYPNFSPYIYSANNPISYIDKEGKYALFIHYMLTRYQLMKSGVPEVVSNLIAHYASTFSDNPGGMSDVRQRIVKNPKIGMLIIAQNKSDSQKSNPIFNSIGGSLSAEQASGLSYNDAIDYSRSKNSQGESSEAQLWHVTRTYSEKDIVSANMAINRSLSNAWDLLFDSASKSSLENMKANTSAIENLGFALHTFQDAKAHQGAVFRATIFNLKGYCSTNGNEHDLDNDVNPDEKLFNEARKATKGAILVHQILNGNYSNLQDGQKVYTEGMSKSQMKRLDKALRKGGFESTESGRTDSIKIVKK